MTLSIGSTVVVAADQVSTGINDETVVLGLQRGIYYGVDGIGQRIWQLLQAPIPVATIRDTLLEEYDVDAATCEHDLLRFLAELEREGLLDVRG